MKGSSTSAWGIRKSPPRDEHAPGGVPLALCYFKLLTRGFIAFLPCAGSETGTERPVQNGSRFSAEPADSAETSWTKFGDETYSVY